MVARSIKRFFRAAETFTYQQVFEAVDLLQMCGLDRERYEEMWAVVSARGKRVGELYIGHLISRVGGNGTDDVSVE